MKFDLVLSGRAQRELRQIVHWMTPKSTSGVSRWLERFDEAVGYLTEHARDCPEAEEAFLFDYPIQQHTFKTRRGNPYRLVFFAGDTVITILSIRGAGQDWLEPGDFT